MKPNRELTQQEQEHVNNYRNMGARLTNILSAASQQLPANNDEQIEALRDHLLRVRSNVEKRLYGNLLDAYGLDKLNTQLEQTFKLLDAPNRDFAVNVVQAIAILNEVADTLSAMES